MMEDKKQSGGAEMSTERAQIAKEGLIRAIAPVLAECYRNMDKEEFEDVCNCLCNYGMTAKILLPITGAEAMEAAIKEM